VVGPILTSGLRIAPTIALYLLLGTSVSVHGRMLDMFQEQALQPFVMRRPMCSWVYQPVFVEDWLCGLGAFEGVVMLVLAPIALRALGRLA
jgi:hypothetical protein